LRLISGNALSSHESEAIDYLSGNAVALPYVRELGPCRGEKRPNQHPTWKHDAKRVRKHDRDLEGPAQRSSLPFVPVVLDSRVTKFTESQPCSTLAA
jgi:hypothetical protein